MKKLILLFIVISVIIPTISFAVTFNVEGIELNYIKQKAIEKIIIDAGIDIEKATVKIVFTQTEKFSDFVNTNIIVDDQLLEGSSICPLMYNFESIKNSVKKAVKQYKKPK